LPTAPSRLFVCQQHESIVRSIVRQSGGLRVGAVDAIKNQDTSPDVMRV
jgi:hypothetical protein